MIFGKSGRLGWRFVLASSLICGLATTAPAGASSSGLLLLKGSRTAWTDVVIKSTLHVDYSASAFETSGRFIGFYAEALDVPVSQRIETGHYLGAVRLRDFRTPDTTHGLLVDLTAQRETSLEPGRYRFYLVTDGPGVVRLHLEGGAQYAIAPTHATYAHVVASPDIRQSPATASSTHALQLRGRRTVSVSGIVVGRFRAFAGQIAACLSKPGATCGSATSSGVDGAYTGYVLSPLRDTDFAFQVLYQPGILPTAPYDAQQSSVNATTLQFASCGAFTLQLA